MLGFVDEDLVYVKVLCYFKYNWLSVWFVFF